MLLERILALEKTTPMPRVHLVKVAVKLLMQSCINI